jgi:hypothetical protein
MAYYVGANQLILASSGGRGSYSFADTTVFGERGLRVTDPRANSHGTERAVVPGGGGGARANRQLPFGSHAVGYSPHGVVVIRLTRIE